LTLYRVALIEGDGVGPEISKVAIEVIEAIQRRFNINFEIKPAPAGDSVLKQKGEALPNESLSVIKASDVCLKGPVGESAADVIVRLRQMLQLYANIRPSKSLPQVDCLSPKVDLVIVRENTEDLYSGMEFDVGDGVVALRLITRRACERIARYAFQLAEQRNKKRKVVAIHKSNVLRKSDGLFSQICREVSRDYPSISLNEMYVDATAMNLIRSPESFDVLVTTNLFGDILSDEAAQLVGGLGLAPSANIGENFALFEPVHGSAPDIAGKGIANPIAMMLSVNMMLEWLNSSRKDEECMRASIKLQEAIFSVLKKGMKTPDLGGDNTTSQVGSAIAKEIHRK
jgi:3-isopropylmalate dehydrogenase